MLAARSDKHTKRAHVRAVLRVLPDILHYSDTLISQALTEYGLPVSWVLIRQCREALECENLVPRAETRICRNGVKIKPRRKTTIPHRAEARKLEDELVATLRADQDARQYISNLCRAASPERENTLLDECAKIRENTDQKTQKVREAQKTQGT